MVSRPLFATFLLFLLLALSFASLAQHRYNHNLSWLRVALSDTFASKFKWELYVQKRTQNTVTDKADIFESNQFKSLWLWFHYALNKSSRISISPFGYFESYVLNTKSNDEDLPPIKEFRWSVKYENEKKGKLFNYSNRYNLEYRLRDLLNNNNYQPNWRVRYMARLEMPVVVGVLSKTKPLTLIAYDEIFLQFGKAVRNNPNVFDQNRLYVGFNYEIVKNIKTTFGYIYGFQERNSGMDFDNINTYWLIISFDNLISQFLKKK